jgi:hypothetical protein
MNEVRLLVCGNREWQCIDTIRAWLTHFPPNTTVIHGAQRTKRPPGADGPVYYGADHIADMVARELKFAVIKFPADWDKHGNAAGPLRNRQMLKDGKPTRGLAFGSLSRTGFDNRSRLSGTGDMVMVLNEAGILVTIVPSPDVLP